METNNIYLSLHRRSLRGVRCKGTITVRCKTFSKLTWLELLFKKNLWIITTYINIHKYLYIYFSIEYLYYGMRLSYKSIYIYIFKINMDSILDNSTALTLWRIWKICTCQFFISNFFFLGGFIQFNRKIFCDSGYTATASLHNLISLLICLIIVPNIVLCTWVPPTSLVSIHLMYNINEYLCKNTQSLLFTL